VTGTTTIMYTDLVGSSELLAAMGSDGYAAYFSNHVATIRTEVEARGGRVNKLLGDGVLALFDSAYAGVTAAIAVQQAVDAANRRGHGPDAGLRVGLSVGEVVEASDDLFGTALVVARRLCDVAAAGDILVSEIVTALVGGRSDVEFTTLGPFELKGLPQPVEVASVAWEPREAETSLRVIVADDAPFIRSGIVRLLADGGFVVIAEVDDADALLAAVAAEPPDLVVTDIRMPPTNTDDGLKAAATIREQHPDVAVLVLSQHVEARSAAGLLDGRPAGVGYLLKERVTNLAEFVEACRSVVGGGYVVDPMVTEQLLRRRQGDGALERLTNRERDVLALMAQGRSNQAIASELLVGHKTLETYVRAIFQKLDLEETPEDHRRVQAVLRWLQADPS